MSQAVSHYNLHVPLPLTQRIHFHTSISSNISRPVKRYKFKVLVLASCNLKVFPEFLRFQHQLEYLSLDNNNIEGLIPGWMWNISKNTLRDLSLSQNLLGIRRCLCSGISD
ncbi:putative leucine-rich repeat domain superfamily [Helianthus anomalus]